MTFIERLETRTLFAALPTGFSETTIADGIAGPTAMEFAPDGRLFVAEQTGALRVIKNGALQASPFMTLRVDSNGERGLLGVAFDPQFAANHFVYVYYTVAARRGVAVHNRVSRFVASGDVAAKHSETILLEIDNLSSATNHNGGAIHFGPDRKLYISTGDNNNGSNAQSFSSLLGKILRINPDGSIPTDNPFYSTTTGLDRAIWAMGLRNPFSFSFQPGAGRMLINDVGEHTYEEINEGIRASNYGWPMTEGPTTRKHIRAPIFYYQHGSSDTTGDAIVGSAFYNPPSRTFPRRYTGLYFFADLTSGWIRMRNPANGDVATFARGIDTPVALAVNGDGSLWYLARGSGDATGIVVRVDF